MLSPVLRSTRTTARHAVVWLGGRSSVSESPPLEKTHLSPLLFRTQNMPALLQPAPVAIEYTATMEILPVADTEPPLEINSPLISLGALAYTELLMTPKWTGRLAESVSALWKRILSFLKHDWELRDYPIRIRELQVDPAFQSRGFKSARYVASIINWWVMDGTGDTKAEALDNLSNRFQSEKTQRLRDGKPMPRPGTHVPIEFASQVKINEHAELSEDFIRRVLELEWAWISDQSSLGDFHTDETNDHLFAKIKAIYGVDVSDIKSGRLSDIFDRIAASQSRD